MIVIAMPSELNLIKHYDEPILITGVGANNVIQALRDLDKNTPIFNIGYAGSNVLPIGTRIRVGKVEIYHPTVKYNDKIYQLDGTIPCYTSCDFVTATTITEPCVFDMELAFILSLGFKNVISEKVVSDNLNLKEFEHTNN